MHFLQSNIILSIVMLCSVCGLIASEKATCDHEEEMSTWAKTNVYLKKEEKGKLKHGSLYELVGVNVEKGTLLASLPDDVKNASNSR